jgi:ferritin-like metal-binding protein YciE
MATIKGPNELLLTFMQDIYYAERQILKALPKMAKATKNEALQEAFMHHREETQGQVERLQKAFDALGKRARGVTCEAGLIACAQAVEHYEMARYGSLIAWARAAGNKEVAALMEETLAEEKKADGLLNQLASKDVNKQAFSKAA